MYKEPKIQLDTNEFDYLILGTGLIEQLLSASLAIQGNKILNIDFNDYYSQNMRSLNLR